MKETIRSYTQSDFEEVASWWQTSTGLTPLRGMLVEEGTFIMELNDVPALCLTVLLTQSKDMAYLFAYVKNPMFKSSLEKQGKALWDHCASWTKSKGYSRLICFSDNPKLIAKYQRFGAVPTLTNLTGFLIEV